MTLIDPARRWTLKRVFAFGAAAAALITVGAIALGTAALVRLSDTRTVLLDQVGPAVLSGQVLLSDLINQETGVRGYVLSGGNPDDLTPYTQGLAAQQTDEAAIRALTTTGSYPTIMADLDALDAAVGAWRSTYAQAAIDRRPGAPTTDGRVLFDKVRASVARLQSDLNGERIAARNRLNIAANSLAWVGTGVALMIAGFLIAAAFGLRRSVLRPVSELAAQVRAVASGDTDHPITVEGPREIIELGADVESMRLAIKHDVDTAQEANRVLDAQTRDLERSNNDLEQFAYVASHDLQEPLRKVASFCQLLQRRYAGKLDDRADQYIAFAVDGAERMQALINDLLVVLPGRAQQRGVHRRRARRGRRGGGRPAGARAGRRRRHDRGEAAAGDPRRRLAAAGSVHQPHRKRHEVPPGGGTPGGERGCERDRRRVGDHRRRQRHRYRSGVRRQGFRDLPTFARPGCLCWHRYRPGAGEEDRGVPRRAHRHRPTTHGSGHHSPARRASSPGDNMIASAARVINVLLVEDDPGDVLMTREAFEEYLNNRLDVVSDGSEALAYLRREGQYADAPRPDLILLDLNLPSRDGREVLAEVKADENLQHIPVIVLTTSRADEDVLRSYQLHANAYVTKPVDFDGFIEAIKQIDHFFVSVVQLPATSED